MVFENKVVLVTGGGTGLGREIVLAAAAQGARVAINYSRSRSDAQATAEEAAKLCHHAIAIQANVEDPVQSERLIEKTEKALGPIHALVNCAGITRGVPFADIENITPEDWESIFNVNLFGAWHCARAAAIAMRRHGEGSILNVASDSAISLAGSSIPYVVSKAGLVALTRCLAKALFPTIRVNAIAPGWMETRWLEENLNAEQQMNVRSSQVCKVDLHDAASLALELIRNKSITGQTVVIDAGDGIA